MLVCNRGDCRAEAAADGREPAAAAEPGFCEFCGGSPVTAAVRAMEAACRDAGIARIVVLGGSPMLRTRLEQEASDGPTLRLVDGTRARTAAQVREDLAWADAIVIWAGTELAHKATMAYPTGEPRVITVTARGIPALARRVVRFARERGGEEGRAGATIQPETR